MIKLQSLLIRNITALTAASLLLCSCGGDKESAPETEPAATETAAETAETETTPAAAEPSSVKAGDLELSPASLHHKAKVGTEEVEFVYTAVNLGSEPITITGVDSGCACIEESVEPRKVPPGESARISAIYSTEKLNGMAEKIISIATDQPGIREAFLKVKLEMEPIYVIDRDLTTWGKGDKPETKVVTFEVTREQPIHILSAKSSRAEITAEIKEVKKGKKYQILLTPESTGSNMLGMVRITTDCEIEAHARPLLYVTVQ